MYSWVKDVINQVVYTWTGIAKKSAGYNFYLSIFDCIMLAFRDLFAYIVTVHAVYSGLIEVWELVLYLGTITCVSSFFSDLTNNLATMGQRNLEIIAIREFMERDIYDNGVEFMTDKPLKIELIDVSFRFREEAPYVLRHVNLTIHENEKLAIVGENGAGKSTLVKIICGLYKPTEGRVLVNGIDIDEVNMSSYQKLLATAFQDTYIMPMSIGENIAFGVADSHVEEINKCLELADLDEEFLNQKKPLTRMLDSDGLVPSGGQKQKLIFARVAFKLIYRNAQMLILDEPTSAMDAISERIFYEKYIDLSKEKTCILVSHRMKSTSFCDLIIVMEKGKIIESGTHVALMNKNSRYREMYDLQSSYYQ